MAETSEAVLIEQCKRGDEEAFKTLLNSYRHRAVNLAYQILGNQADAEDIAQEAFIKVFKSISKFRQSASFFSWLYRIIINLCSNKLKEKKRIEYGSELRDKQAVSADFARAVETKLIVQQTINSLPPVQRIVLILRELQELDYREISRILKIPIGTVRSRLNVARQRFKNKFLKLERRNQ